MDDDKFKQELLKRLSGIDESLKVIVRHLMTPSYTIDSTEPLKKAKLGKVEKLLL